jgi:hypothetical protein
MALTSEEEFDGRPPYAFRRGFAEEAMGPSKKTVRVTREGGEYKAEIDEGGRNRVMVLPSIDYTLADEMAAEIWIRKKPKVGESLRVRNFDLDDLETDVERMEVIAVKKGVMSALSIDVFEIEIQSEKTGMKYTIRADSFGNALTLALGDTIEARREPEEIAKKIEYSHDLFVFGMAKLDKPLGTVPGKVESLVLEVHGETAAKIPDGPRQSLRQEGEKVLLYLGADHGKRVEATQEEIAENLKETADLPIKDEKVMALARKAIGDAADDREKVKRLVAFVETYLEDVVANPISFFEILKSKKGDCSEHAYLFTALARAVSVPAREVSGLGYMGDDFRAFGGHAWCEVVLDGCWVPVDPTWGEFDLDATHISFVQGRKDTSFELLGRLSFRLVSVNGKKPTEKDAGSPRKRE